MLDRITQKCITLNESIKYCCITLSIKMSNYPKTKNKSWKKQHKAADFPASLTWPQDEKKSTAKAVAVSKCADSPRLTFKSSRMGAEHMDMYFWWTSGIYLHSLVKPGWWARPLSIELCAHMTPLFASLTDRRNTFLVTPFVSSLLTVSRSRHQWPALYTRHEICHFVTKTRKSKQLIQVKSFFIERLPCKSVALCDKRFSLKTADVSKVTRNVILEEPVL